MGNRLEEAIFYQGERHVVKRGWLVILLGVVLTAGTLLLLPFASMCVSPRSDTVVVTPVHSVKLPPKKEEKPKVEKELRKRVKSASKVLPPKLHQPRKRLAPVVDIPLALKAQNMDFSSNVLLNFAVTPSESELATPSLERLAFDVDQVETPPEEVGGSDSLVPYDVDQVDTNPEKISGADPRVPHRAISRSISGYVSTVFVVNKEGEVEDIQVVDVKPKGLFERGVLRALRTWRYKPGTKDGQNVATRMKKKFVFNVE